MSMSNIWLMPTMATFMSRAETSACARPATAACVPAQLSPWVCSASRLMLTTLMAVPAIVCGLVKRSRAGREVCCAHASKLVKGGRCEQSRNKVKVY